MKITSKVRAEGTYPQHNETLVRTKRVRIKSGVRAGYVWPQHNETLVRTKRVRIKSGVRAGDPGLATNHNETLLGMR